MINERAHGGNCVDSLTNVKVREIGVGGGYATKSAILSILNFQISFMVFM